MPHTITNQPCIEQAWWLDLVGRPRRHANVLDLPPPDHTVSDPLNLLARAATVVDYLRHCARASVATLLTAFTVRTAGADRDDVAAMSGVAGGR